MIKGQQGCLLSRALVNAFEISGNSFVVFPRDIFHRITHHVDNTQVDLCCLECRVNRIRETLEAIHAGNQDIFHAAILELREDIKPELRPLVFRDPQAQQFFLPLKINTQGQEIPNELPIAA